MRVVIIGGTGLIGRKLAAKLESGGHQVVAASPSTGVNSLTGEGLEEALTGANVVVDVTNSPSFEDDAVMEFFRRSTGHLLSAAAAAGVSHYVALSVVGSDRIHDSGYLRAKRAQEGLIEAGGVPYTVMRATQFFEFRSRTARRMGKSFIRRLPSSNPSRRTMWPPPWPRSRLRSRRTASSSWRAPKPPAWPSSSSRFCRPSATRGRSSPIPMQNTSARSSTKTALRPRANTLPDRHALPIGYAPELP
jgi:NAD(P)-dependent dehydrogenase (short-subunit alcohol dehydrogenase family)